MPVPKKVLFIHQNFPGQFVHVAQALVRQGCEVVALGIEGRPLAGVKYLRYTVPAPKQSSSVPGLRDFETKVQRGMACLAAMGHLREQGFQPDLVVAHPGWGESLFVKDVWPGARLVVFSEFYYRADGADFAFDPEFGGDSLEGRTRLRLRNTMLLHALESADQLYAPTEWQRSLLPEPYRQRTQVIFDGIDTGRAAPDAQATLGLQREGLVLRPGDEVLTFVNRNLEPYRGFHVFMRALPEILARRPQARCVIVGRESVSYGAAPAGGGTWREHMLREVGDRLPMDRVHFLGGLPYADYLRVLQVSACHVYLTYPFVLSWSCLEAMSAGCAVLASNTAPVAEVIEDGRNGWLFDFFDIRQLADRAVDLLAGAVETQRVREQARKTVVGKYDLETVCLPAQLSLLSKL